MRVFQLLHDLYIIELDIKELVNGFKNAFDRDIVLELNGHFMVDEGLEEAEEQHCARGEAVVVFAPTWMVAVEPHLEKSWRPLLFPFIAAAKAILDMHKQILALQVRETRKDQRYY